MKLKTLIRFPKFAKNFKIHFNSLESLLTLFMQNTIASQKMMLQLLAKIGHELTTTILNNA